MVFIGVLGVNHKTADLSLRENIAERAIKFCENPFLPYPTVLLSTCNRTEIYFHSEDLALAHSQLLRNFGNEQAFYSFFGIYCFFHLCKVASGFDSAVFAESEIQRQVKKAYANAKSLPSCMHYVFQKALKVSKEIRSKYQQNSQSLYHALWRMCEWKNRKILIVGFSQINRGLISFLLHKKVDSITLCTRNPQTVQIEGVSIGDRRLLSEWENYDVIVSASFGEGFLIRGKGEKGQVIFDLGVPRNVDPQVGATLYNIEDVHKSMEVPDASVDEAFIWQHVVRLMRIYKLKTQRALDIAEMELHL